MKLKITTLLLSLLGLTNVAYAETSDADSQKIIANQESNKSSGQAAIRVSNKDEVLLSPNSDCANQSAKNAITAANGGSGFSSWGKSKRVGMPKSKLTEKGDYSEYNVPANAPITITIKTKADMYNTHFYCAGEPYVFTPMAGHNYEVYLAQDFDRRTCHLIGTELVLDPAGKWSAEMSLAALRPTKTCGQETLVDTPTKAMSEKNNSPGDDIRVVDEVFAGKLHSRKTTYLRAGAEIGVQKHSFDINDKLERVDLSGVIPSAVNVKETAIYVAPNSNVNISGGGKNKIFIGRNSQVNIKEDNDEINYQ